MLFRSDIGLMLVVLALVSIALPSAAQAYVDPGTGSFVIQGIIAAVVGAGVAIKLFWGRIKSAITGKPASSEEDDG